MNRRSIIGILVIGVGLLMLAGAMGLVETEGLWATYWPVILIAIGLINLSEGGKNYLFSIIMMGIGVLFLLKNLGIEYMQNIELFELIWPVIIITVGVWLLTAKHRPRQFRHSERYADNDDTVDMMVMFSGSETNNQSQDFKGGQVSAIFGGIDLDLRGAKIQDGPVKMDIFAAFGGADIIVPEDWRVRVTGVPIFGGWSNKTRFKTTENKNIDLDINCLVLFGGFEIKNK